MLRWGTGALNVDACRIAGQPWKAHDATGLASVKFFTNGDAPVVHKEPHTAGRWPANVILSHSLFCRPVGTKRVKGAKGVRGSDTGSTMYGGGKGLNRPTTGQQIGYADADGYETVEAWECADDCPVALLDAQSGERKSGGGNKGNRAGQHGWFGLDAGRGFDAEYAPDSGGASRFYYVAKASRKERRGSKHPTVKPVALMRYLIRLVTPPGGTILDPFAGSGTTGEAAMLEGVGAVLIEREAEYVADIHARLGIALDMAADG